MAELLSILGGVGAGLTDIAKERKEQREKELDRLKEMMALRNQIITQFDIVPQGEGAMDLSRLFPGVFPMRTFGRRKADFLTDWLTQQGLFRGQTQPNTLAQPPEGYEDVDNETGRPIIFRNNQWQFKE